MQGAGFILPVLLRRWRFIPPHFYLSSYFVSAFFSLATSPFFSRALPIMGGGFYSYIMLDIEVSNPILQFNLSGSVSKISVHSDFRPPFASCTYNEGLYKIFTP